MENQIAFAGAAEPEHKLVITELEIQSVKQFLVLSFLSLGLYPAWWSYKVWRFFKEKEDLDLSPAWRAILSIFFIIPLFNKILHYAQSRGCKDKYDSVILYMGIMGIWLLSKVLPIPYWLISLFHIALFIPPFKALNHALAIDPEIEVDVQTSINGRQIILTVAVGILWFFALVGLLSLFLGSIGYK